MRLAGTAPKTTVDKAGVAQPVCVAKDVNGDVFSLYGAASGNDSVAKDSDAAPTAALVAAASKVESEVALILKAWDQIKTTDIPAVNRQLKSANLPELRPEVNPDAEESAVNQE